MQFKPVDLIAGIAVIGAFVTKALGYDHTVDSILLAIAAFYFGYNAATSWTKA